MISKSNHVKFARFVLLDVSEEAKKITSIFSFQCIIKQLLDSVFVIFRIIEVSVRVISLSLRLRLITPTSTSIILDITKTSSNNCLLCTNILSALHNQMHTNANQMHRYICEKSPTYPRYVLIDTSMKDNLQENG